MESEFGAAAYDNQDSLLRERERLARFGEQINAALIAEGDLKSILARCAGCLATGLDAAIAGIWKYNEEQNTLEMQALAGAAVTLESQRAGISSGQRQIWLIAKREKPCVVNDIYQSPHFADKNWIKKSGIRAFAGYPLRVENRLVGVTCIFSRALFSDLTVQALASAADAIANGIKRKAAEDARRALLIKLEEARECERRRLSRQLHDEIAQQLVAASMRLQKLERQIIELHPDDHSLIADLVITQELLLRNHRSLRLMAHELHSEILERFGLPEALNKFVSEAAILTEDKITAFSLDIQADFPRFPPSIEQAIYRIVQEAVNNALRYAGAKTITLRLALENETIRVAVVDDGCGFDPEKTLTEGIGFASMRERAEIIGARLSIASQINKGTAIGLTIPHEK